MHRPRLFFKNLFHELSSKRSSAMTKKHSLLRFLMSRCSYLHQPVQKAEHLCFHGDGREVEPLQQVHEQQPVLGQVGGADQVELHLAEHGPQGALADLRQLVTCRGHAARSRSRLPPGPSRPPATCPETVVTQDRGGWGWGGAQGQRAGTAGSAGPRETNASTSWAAGALGPRTAALTPSPTGVPGDCSSQAGTRKEM